MSKFKPATGAVRVWPAPAAPSMASAKRAAPPLASPSKRFKPSRRSPESSSEVDSLNLGSGHHPRKPATDFSDLHSKSLQDLRSLLSFNQMFRAMIGQMISDHIQNTQHNDIMALSLYLSQTEDRIHAVEQRIATLDAIHDPDDPRPIPPTRQRDTPPPSMSTSDSSNTTLDTALINPAADSPDPIELDLQDISTATLVVGDSDDAYYDKFDPIPDDFLDTLKSDIPPPPASATPSGRIDHTSSPHYTEVISILKNTFKLSSFRTNQLECIVATLDGKDVFYLAPTGGGKSLCFQLPALCVSGKTQGTTFVISPLISLITDQVQALRNKGVPAFPLTSAAEENEVRQAMRMMRSNAEEKPKLVYTTPERLQKSDSLRDVVNQLYEEKQLARFVIDEAHVIGSWGRDFRASYAELNILRKNWPTVPIMALTGSANKDAIEDIKHNLAMRNPVCLAQSFNRPNLHYSVRKKPALKKDLLQSIAGFIKTHHPGDTGIIYTLSRVESEEMAQKLREEWGIEARYYHAGIKNDERKINQDDWMAGRCKVIVATIAFGMGIDKPDVRFVIHATLSKDMDGYYQETGRAGRDGKSSDCVLFYAWTDVSKIKNMLQNPNPSDHAPSGSEIERQVAKLQDVAAYCSNESDCRRALILRHFDEEFKAANCHNQCDNCHRSGKLVQQDFTSEAKQMIQLLQEMMNTESRGVTKAQLKDTWKGMKNRTVQPYKGLSLYASGKGLGHPTVDRLFDHLAAEGVIESYRVPNSNGYSNNYIRLDNRAAEYLDGGKQLVLTWKEKEDTKPPAKKVAPKPESRAKGKAPDPLPRVSLYEDIEDADDTSESEELREMMDNADLSEPTTSVVSLAGTSRSAGSMDVSMEIPTAGYEDAIASRLKRLRDTRRLISEKFKRYPEDTILQDDTLEMLALAPPEDAHTFKNILRDCEDSEQVEDKWNSFGHEFLAALKALSTHKLFNIAQMRRDFAFNG